MCESCTAWFIFIIDILIYLEDQSSLTLDVKPQYDKQNK